MYEQPNLKNEKSSFIFPLDANIKNVLYLLHPRPRNGKRYSWNLFNRTQHLILDLFPLLALSRDLHLQLLLSSF